MNDGAWDAGTAGGPSAEDGELRALRQKIDELDEELVALLNRRASLSVEVGRVKGGAATEIYQPDREAQVHTHVAAVNTGPLSSAALRAIYGEILSASRSIQRGTRVGYLGPAGTFTHEAALRRFGSSAVLVPCATIEDVFRETQKGNVDYGVVGVENSTAGAVTSTLDVFLDSTVQICAEVELPISHHLLSRGTIGQIRRVYSHPQGLAQCRRWLGEHLPHAEQIETASTVLAAQLSKSPDTAAIGPEAAARLYGLTVIAPRIEDAATNVTRFLVIGPTRGPRTGRDKTAVVFSVKNRPGALRDALEAFARRGIDLTRIESRPSRRQLWEYVFFADMAGHPEDEAVAAALAELDRGASFVKVLGAWPVD
jgi:chorismate mutase/prephenate dehydratase